MSSFLIGIILGVMISIVLIILACMQMWPKWKKWGFIRAINVQEREKLKSYQSYFYKNIFKYSWIGIIIYPASQIAADFFGEDVVLGTALGFLIFFLPGYILACFILDYLERKSFIKF
ncbi:MAG: hypothetical protein AAB509_03170 [Patescibacteria group bacterium]